MPSRALDGATFRGCERSRFGSLALQNGLINQVQLVAAFQTWTLDKAKSLADQLVARGDLDAEQRAGVEAPIALHAKKHGDVEKSLAAAPAGKSTLEIDWGLAKPLGRVEPGPGAGERTLVPSSASGCAETLLG
jgi:hypothetical protein